MKFLELSASVVSGALLLLVLSSVRTSQDDAGRAAPEQDATLSSRPKRTRVYVELPTRDIASYVSLAEHIVDGSVLDKRQVFPPEGLPYTEYDVMVQSLLKGATAKTIQVRVGGAQRESYTVDVVGAPRFETGEEVVLFLAGYADGGTGRPYYGILGLSQGAYRLGRDSVGTRRVVGGFDPYGTSFEELEATIRGLLQQQKPEVK